MTLFRLSETWFLILASLCVVAPYLLGVRPTTARHRMQVAVTIGFLLWVLGFMVGLRSR